MIKTIFFDVGGTLIHPHPSVGEVYAQCARRHGVHTTPHEIEAKFRIAWKEAKKISTKIDETWWRDVVTKVFENITFLDFDKFFLDLYKTFDQPSSWKIFPDALTTLPRLKTLGLRLAVASNWDSRLPPLLDKLNLSSYFERQFISFHMGCAKPDPDFFKRALNVMEINPLEALHVGDDFTEDIQCAQKAGIRAYLIDRNKKPINSRMLSNLEDILLRI